MASTDVQVAQIGSTKTGRKTESNNSTCRSSSNKIEIFTHRRSTKVAVL